jgi:AcrR family transcriptional regulator
MEPARARQRAARSDAARNHERILEAARAVFGEYGLAVPIDEVARRAKVGAGTVYRHFPSKESLYEAVLLKDIGALIGQASALAASPASPAPGETLFSFLREMVGASMAKRELIEALASAGVDLKARAGAHFEELRSAVGVLLERAQEAGAVRPDIETDDLMALTSSCCQIAMARHTEGPGGALRLTAFVFDGLRPR